MALRLRRGMTMNKVTVGVLLVIGPLMTMFAATANAATIVLDPGPGTDYLGVWCGGQHVNEIATGFDAGADAVALVKVTTTCHGSGRGSPNQYYLACWTVTFAQDGGILSKEWLATNHWRQGQTAIPCPVPADPAAVYTNQDEAGNVLATLSTELIGASSAVYRAVLETTCAPIKFGDTVSGTIGKPGEQACYSFRGSAGNGVRVGVVETSGTLLAVQEVRRPDGTVVCSLASGTVDCTLDASGFHTIAVRDSSGTGTGDYDLTLACLTPSCGGKPSLAIDMTAVLTPGRLIRTLAYTITVSNGGGAPAANVVVEDTLPQGLYVRSLSSTQGTCTHAQRAVTCAVGSLDPLGSVTVNITTATLKSSGQVTNTACVDTSNCATTITDLP
jgi:uncharacterized repeat protein (TIGR01451 family)